MSADSYVFASAMCYYLIKTSTMADPVKSVLASVRFVFNCLLKGDMRQSNVSSCEVSSAYEDIKSVHSLFTAMGGGIPKTTRTLNVPPFVIANYFLPPPYIHTEILSVHSMIAPCEVLQCNFAPTKCLYSNYMSPHFHYPLP